MKNKKGISLIVLIVTIIVIIILAAVVILTLSKNNPIESAKEARFKEDVRTYQDELNMYITKEYQMLAGQRDSKITATGYEKDSRSDEYNNSVYKYLSSFKKKYENKIAIENDEIVYIGRDKKEREWTNNIVKMNPILTVKYIKENGEEIAPIYEIAITNGNYSVDSPIIEGYEPDNYKVSGQIEKDTEITVTYYPWSEGLEYEELDDGTYTVASIGSFTGNNLIIPRQYNEKDVTEIKQDAFRSKNINIVIISEIVKRINSHAFYYNTLKELNLNAESVSGLAFRQCSNLKKVIIGDKFKNSDTSDIFFHCSNIEELILGNDIANINARMCGSAVKLREVKINSNNKKYKVVDGVLFSIDGTKLCMYPPGKGNEYVIPSDVNEIGEEAFYGSNINELEIPNTVKKVGSQAFYNSSIKKVTLNADNISGLAFRVCSNLISVNIGKNVTSIGGSVFFQSNSITEVNFTVQ